jgi:acetamidase/formamidase
MTPRFHELPATPATVHWGYFDAALEPVLTVASGDVIGIEEIHLHEGIDRVARRRLELAATRPPV